MSLCQLDYSNLVEFLDIASQAPMPLGMERTVISIQDRNKLKMKVEVKV